MEFTKNIYYFPFWCCIFRLTSTLRKSQLELEKMGKVFISGIFGLAVKKLHRHFFFYFFVLFISFNIIQLGPICKLDLNYTCVGCSIKCSS